MDKLEKRITALEEEVQELRKMAGWRQLDKKNILDAITIEVERLQKLNEASVDQAELRDNAKCIAELGQTFADILDVCNRS